MRTHCRCRARPLRARTFYEKVSPRVLPWKYYVKAWYWYHLGFVPKEPLKCPSYYPDKMRQNNVVPTLSELILVGQSFRTGGAKQAPSIVP